MGLRSGAARTESFTRSSGDGPVTVTKAISGSVRVTLIDGESGHVEVLGKRSYEEQWSFTSLAAAVTTADIYFWDACDEHGRLTKAEKRAFHVMAAILTLAAHREAIPLDNGHLWEAWDLTALRRRVLLQ